jgi:hypothetical protein
MDLNPFDLDAEVPGTHFEDWHEPKDPGVYIPTHSPIDVLPDTLQYLKISEADETVCSWLEDLFRYKWEYYKELAVVELIVTEAELKDKVKEMEGQMKEMALGSGVAVAVKLDNTTIGGPSER